VDEVPTNKEVMVKLRFKKKKNSSDQLPSQNSTVGGTVDSNSRGLMLPGVNAQDVAWCNAQVRRQLVCSFLFLFYFTFKLKTFRWQREAQYSKVAEFWVCSWADG
jgi:hypothetical protein